MEYHEITSFSLNSVEVNDNGRSNKANNSSGTSIKKVFVRYPRTLSKYKNENEPINMLCECAYRSDGTIYSLFFSDTLGKMKGNRKETTRPLAAIHPTNQAQQYLKVIKRKSPFSDRVSAIRTKIRAHTHLYAFNSNERANELRESINRLVNIFYFI